MIINHNLPALNTYNRLAGNTLGMSKSLERLSSGMRINRAADDAAGLAISEKMRAQIRGLHQAGRNVQDGISLIQTAEGALSEVHEILQRTRELCVQAANDTYTSNDRLEIQREIDQLRDEIDRISNSTQFNAKNLLDGSTSALVSSDRISTRVFMRGGMRIVDQFNQKASGSGNYRLEITADPGSGQVQKTDIFRVKHCLQKVADYDAGQTGIEYISTTDGPSGYYEMDSIRDQACIITCSNTPLYSTADLSSSYFQNPCAVTAVSVSHDNAVNASALFEVIGRSATEVRMRVTLASQGPDGCYRREIISCLTMTPAAEICAVNIGCINGLLLDLDACYANYTVGDKFVVDTNAAATATRNFTSGTTNISQLSGICMPAANYHARLATSTVLARGACISSSYFLCTAAAAVPTFDGYCAGANTPNGSLLFEVTAVCAGYIEVCILADTMDTNGCSGTTAMHCVIAAGSCDLMIAGLCFNLNIVSLANYSTGDKWVLDLYADAAGAQTVLCLAGPCSAAAGFNQPVKYFVVDDGAWDNCISGFRSFYLNVCNGCVMESAWQMDLSCGIAANGLSTFTATAELYARTTLELTGPMPCALGCAQSVKSFSFYCGALDNTETDLHTFYVNALTGAVSDSSFRLTLRDSCIFTSGACDASFCINYDSIGSLADPSTRLYDLEKFWDASGNFTLEPARTIYLVQANGARAMISFNKADTISSVIDKLNSAIAVDLGQCVLTGGDGRHFVSYVNTPRSNSGQETVPGTFIIRSAIPGQGGEISVFGDDEVLKALSLMTIQEARDNVFSVDIYEAHSGEAVKEDVMVSGNNLSGVIHQNVDVQFSENTGIDVLWNTASRRFDNISSGTCVTYVHIADNSMVFQVGANARQDVMAAIGNMSVRSLGLESLQVFTNDLANEALGRIDQAIAAVSRTRSMLGAVQNRLEHTAVNLSTTEQNLTAAESRIRDTDMADEMMNFTRYNILNQASTAMLAQANQLPQTILQLLR